MTKSVSGKLEYIRSTYAKNVVHTTYATAPKKVTASAVAHAEITVSGGKMVS